MKSTLARFPTYVNASNLSEIANKNDVDRGSDCEERELLSVLRKSEEAAKRFGQIRFQRRVSESDTSTANERLNKAKSASLLEVPKGIQDNGKSPSAQELRQAYQQRPRSCSVLEIPQGLQLRSRSSSVLELPQGCNKRSMSSSLVDLSQGFHGRQRSSSMHNLFVPGSPGNPVIRRSAVRNERKRSDSESTPCTGKDIMRRLRFDNSDSNSAAQRRLQEAKKRLSLRTECLKSLDEDIKKAEKVIAKVKAKSMPCLDQLDDLSQGKSQKEGKNRASSSF